MKRVYCNSILIKGSTYHLEEKYYIHLIRVMRLNIGDEVTLFNQKSGQWLAVINNTKKKCRFRRGHRKNNTSYCQLKD